MSKLTKSVVDRAQPEARETFIWCSETRGFGLKVFPSGVKTFVLQYRTQEGKSRRLTIGRYSDALTTDQARQIAREKLFAIHKGEDPQAAKQARREALTVNQTLDQYFQSAAFMSKAPSTQYVDLRRASRHIRPLIGSEFADRVTREDVARMHRDVASGKTAGRIKTGSRGLARVTGGEGTANKAVLLLSAVFKWALAERLFKMDGNPCEGVGCSKTGQRSAILHGADDYARVFVALEELENEGAIRPAAADAIRVIALTGARLGEVVRLRWAWVDLVAGLITLPPKAHKAGHATGKPRIIGLPSEAIELIKRQPKGEAEDFVFRPARGVGPLSLTKPWTMVRERAGIGKDIVLHTLRHSLASALAMDGAREVELMQVLGHSQASTTQRYIHFATEARQALAVRASATAAAGLAAAKKVTPSIDE